MFAIFVSVKIKPEKREQFLAAIEHDSICSPRDEPGCVRFDVLQDKADPDRYYFYEVYRDEAALEAHRTFPHYAVWSEAAKECLAEPTSATRTETVFPRNFA